MKPCGINSCVRNHHASLHREVTGETSKGVFNSVRHSEQYVSLGVVPVIINGPKGTRTVCALLDTGANTTLIKREVIEQVGIKGSRTEVTVNTIVGHKSLKASRCDFKVLAIDRSDSVGMSGVFAVDELPVNVRARELGDRISRWPHLADIPLNRVDGCSIDMIIGCDQPKAHWVQEVKLGTESQPFGMRTPLGWIILGPTHQESIKAVFHISAHERGEEDPLEPLIQQLYNQEFDGLGSEEKGLSMEEKEALAIVTAGTERREGRYVVPLPWKECPPRLVNNQGYAMK